MADFTVPLYNYTAAVDGKVRGTDPNGTFSASVTTEWVSTATVNHASAGYITFKTSRVEMTATGTARIRVIRMGGFSGTVSVDIATTSTTGDIAMTSGVHFTAMSETIVFGDGEAGEKYVDVTVGTTPGVGLHMFLVEMTNAVGGVSIRHPYMHVYFDDGGVNTGATSVTATTPADLETTINAAIAGDLIYVRSTAGAYTYNNRTSGQTYGGYTISNTNGTKTAPIVIRNYPAESPQIDQNFAGTHDSAGNDVTIGFLLLAGANYIHIGGIEIIETLQCGVLYDGATIGCVVEDMNIHDVAKTPIGSYALSSHADNIGAVRLDDCVDAIVRNNQLHHIYDPRTGTGTSNPFDAEPYSLHSGIHGYRAKNAWCHGNDLYNVNDGIYAKQAHQLVSGGADGHHVHHNHFYNIVDYGLHIGTSGSGQEPSHNILVHHNVAELDDTTSSDAALVGVLFANDVTAQPDGLYIFNNTQIGGDWLFNIRTMEGIVSYNNILQSSINNLAIEDDSVATYNNQIGYCDYNCYNGITTMKFMTERNGTSTQYTTLASWQTAFSVSSDTQLDRDCDGSSITTAPTFVNAAGDDYTTVSGVTVGTGRFSRDIGIEQEVVGVV